MDVVWQAPGPGMWELDLSHFRGGTTPIVQSLVTKAMTDGMRRIMKDLGAPVDTVHASFVNGFMYARLRPLIGADKPSKKLPPLPILKLATRLHPELRRRARTAERVVRERPWREVIREWDRTGRSAIEADNLALQDVALDDLSDAHVVHHVNAVLAHTRKNWEHHFWLHGYDLGPIGLFLVRIDEWGLDVRAAITLLEGASPSTTAPLAALARIRAAVEQSGREVTTLDDVRATSATTAADLDTYLRYRGSLLFSRYDLDGVTLGERPDLLLATIMSDQRRPAESSVNARTTAMRERLGAEDQPEFDQSLSEARAAMDLRDDNGPTTAEWPLGLLRLSLLHLGQRLVEAGSLESKEHALELTPEELTEELFAGGCPSAASLAERSAERLRCSRLSAPASLGSPEAAPPLSVLPVAMARLVGAIQLVMTQLGMAGDRDALGAGLVGTGVGQRVYRGTARRASTPEEALDAMAPGDVLVVAFTTPAYNVVLSIAGAIVTAVGGPLSHAAVLAREIGIPAVIGAPGALTEICNGDLIDVDPIAGEVRVIERA